MIQCTECNSDNEIGAIFCRTCGAKLDTDNLTPEQIGVGKMKKKGGFSLQQMVGGVRNLVGFFVLLALGLSFLLIFLTPDFRSHAEQAEGEAKKTGLKINTLARTGRAAFNEEEATEVARKLTYLLKADRADEVIDAEVAALSPVSITVNLLPNNRVRLILESSLKEQIDMFTMMEGSVSATPQGLTFTPEKAWAGKFPLHMLGEFGIGVATKRFLPLTQGKPRYDKVQTKVLNGIRTVTIDGTQITLQR